MLSQRANNVTPFLSKFISKRILNLPAGLYYKYFKKYYKTENLRFVYPRKAIDWHFGTRFFWDNYEKKERIFIKKYIKSTDRVLELGACLGIISCLTNKCLGTEESKQHLVVEANPYLAPWLYKNRELNNCQFKIETCAVDDESTKPFYIHPLLVGGSMVRKTQKPLQVVSRTLSEIEVKHGPFNALIMDIEGGEVELIEKFYDRLSAYRILIIEFHPFITGTYLAQNASNILKEKLHFRLVDQASNVQVWMPSDIATHSMKAAHLVNEHKI